jgi:hypothetical protein
VTIFYRPVDRFSLRFEGGKNAVAVIFGYIIFDRGARTATLGTGLNVNVRHVFLPRYLLLRLGVTPALGPDVVG